MSARRPSNRFFGALATVAIAVLAFIGWVSYNALSGLPFENTYRVTVDLPDAKKLISTADVRIAGLRVGRVQDVEAVRGGDSGPASARVELSLEPSAGPLRKDTLVKVRPASVLGASYVELTPGRSGPEVPNGGTLPSSGVKQTVDLTDLFDIFEEQSARAFTASTSELAAGLSGRGVALNATIGNTAKLLDPLATISRAVADPTTQTSRFLQGADGTSAALVPAREDLAGVMTNGATTSSAVDASRDELGQFIDAMPPAEDATTTAFNRVQRPLARLADMMSDLRPATRRLPATLNILDATYETGIPVLRRLPELSDPLESAANTLGKVSRRPSSVNAVRKIPELLAGTNGMLDAITPAQTQCNIFSLATQHLASYIGSMGVGNGPSYAMFGVATLGAQTDEIQSAAPSPDLHVNFTPRMNKDECESGNEPYDPSKQVLGNPTSIEPNTTRPTTPPPGTLSRGAEVGLVGPESTP